MHILLGIISTISVLAIILWHINNAASAINETSHNIKGIKVSLKRFFGRRTPHATHLSLIEDPREAALALMVSIMKDRGDLTSDQINQLEQWAENRLKFSNPKDMVTLARWYVRDYVESGAVLQRVAKPMTRRCNSAQRADIIDLAKLAAQSGPKTDVDLYENGMTQLQAHTIKELKYKFGDLNQDVLLQA